MIYRARFEGRNIDAQGVFRPFTTYCYGDDLEEARLDLYKHFEHIHHLSLRQVSVVRVGECEPGDHIYRVENGRLIGATDPHNSFYVVKEHNNLVCSGAYANHVTCRNGAGVLVPLAPDLECIVHVYR